MLAPFQTEWVMSRRGRRFLGAILVCLGVAAADKAAYTVHLSSVRDGFYRIHEEGIMLHMPDCLRPCAACPAMVQLAQRSVDFSGATCTFERVLRQMKPVVGLYDIWVTSYGRDLYGTRIGGWLIETRECRVDAVETPTRIVIDRKNDRMLIEAADHPDASLSGRVTCPILRVYSEVLF
jgi:hypothetical protein